MDIIRIRSRMQSVGQAIQQQQKEQKDWVSDIIMFQLHQPPERNSFSFQGVSCGNDSFEIEWMVRSED